MKKILFITIILFIKLKSTKSRKIICYDKNNLPIKNRKKINICVFKKREILKNFLDKKKILSCKENKNCYGCCNKKKCIEFFFCKRFFKKKQNFVISYIIIFVFFTGFFFSFLLFLINLNFERIKFFQNHLFLKNEAIFEIDLKKITNFSERKKKTKNFSNISHFKKNEILNTFIQKMNSEFYRRDNEDDKF